MKKLIILAVIVLLTGCTQGSINAVFNNLPQVQQFLDEHPNAKIVANYWTSAEVTEVISSISSTCEKNITIQDMYSVRISEGDFEVSAWFDKNYNPLCIVKQEVPSEVMPANASPVSPEEIETHEEKEVENESPESASTSTALVLKTEISDGCVKLKWTPYPNSDLKYYKIVRSATNEDPKYPEDGYISVITSRLDNTYTDCNPNDGINYYGITIVKTDGNKEYTNPVSVTVENTEEPTSSSVTLNGEEIEGCIKLEWNYEGSTLKYYKVVRSSTNPEPKYPEDGYISVISNKEEQEYTDCAYNDSLINYYRITVVLPDNSKIHSNVLVISNT